MNRRPPTSSHNFMYFVLCSHDSFVYMLKQFTIYSMLMSYLIHYHHHHHYRRSVVAFQHVVTRKVKITPQFFQGTVAPTSISAQQHFSALCRSGGSIHPSVTALFHSQQTATSPHGSPQLSFSSSSSAAASVEDEESDDMTPTFPKFEEITELHPVLKRNLNVLKLERMTEIQCKTWEAASTGEDVLGRARTGTGKTVAFLLPALQQLFLQSEGRTVMDQTKIKMLVLSPTRELAAQIHDQALKLTRTGNNTISHQCMYGGSSKTTDITMLEKKVPMVLVATPGRLKDHLENTLIHNGKRSFKSLLSQVQILVLDETDRYVIYVLQRVMLVHGSFH